MSVPDASLPATPPHAPSAPLNGVSLPGAPLPEAEAAHELPGAPSGDAEPAHAALTSCAGGACPQLGSCRAAADPAAPSHQLLCVHAVAAKCSCPPPWSRVRGMAGARVLCSMVAWGCHCPPCTPMTVSARRGVGSRARFARPAYNHTRERLQFFLVWCSLRAAQVTSLAALLREVRDPHEGYYLPGPQEALLAFLLGEAGLMRLLWDGYSMT